MFRISLRYFRKAWYLGIMAGQIRFFFSGGEKNWMGRTWPWYFFGPMKMRCCLWKPSFSGSIMWHLSFPGRMILCKNRCFRGPWSFLMDKTLEKTGGFWLFPKWSSNRIASIHVCQCVQWTFPMAGKSMKVIFVSDQALERMKCWKLQSVFVCLMIDLLFQGHDLKWFWNGVVESLLCLSLGPRIMACAKHSFPMFSSHMIHASDLNTFARWWDPWTFTFETQTLMGVVRCKVLESTIHVKKT